MFPVTDENVFVNDYLALTSNDKNLSFFVDLFVSPICIHGIFVVLSLPSSPCGVIGLMRLQLQAEGHIKFLKVFSLSVTAIEFMVFCYNCKMVNFTFIVIRI